MSKQVPWNKSIVKTFEEEAMLSELECRILETRVQGWTVSMQAMEFNISESSVARIIKRLKQKYDLVQPKHPDKLPERKFSAKETYMDTH